MCVLVITGVYIYVDRDRERFCIQRHMCIYTHIHTSRHTYKHACVHTSVPYRTVAVLYHNRTHHNITYANTYMHTYLHTCMHACMHTTIAIHLCLSICTQNAACIYLQRCPAHPLNKMSVPIRSCSAGEIGLC